MTSHVSTVFKMCHHVKQIKKETPHFKYKSIIYIKLIAKNTI